MNERIRELAEQAGLPDLLKLTVSHIATDAMEKFAELIVKECVRIDKENPDAAPGVEIARYFGVEE